MPRSPDAFAFRGVHFVRKGEHVPIATPLLAEMKCRRCGRVGAVTVTALTSKDQLLGWCDLSEAAADGLCLPRRAKRAA